MLRCTDHNKLIDLFHSGYLVPSSTHGPTFNGSFNDALSITDYRTSNGSILGALHIEKVLEGSVICLVEISSRHVSAETEVTKHLKSIRCLALQSKLVPPKRKCRALPLLQFVDGTRKSMFMGFRTEQHYGQVLRELKKLGTGRKYKRSV